MDFIAIYILGSYFFTLVAAVVGAFNRGFDANLMQRCALFMFSMWAAWRVQIIYEQGYAWPHEPLAVTAMILYAVGTIQKTILWRKK